MNAAGLQQTTATTATLEAAAATPARALPHALPAAMDVTPYMKARYGALAIAALLLVPTALLIGSPGAAALIAGGVVLLSVATLLLLRGADVSARHALLLVAADGLVVAVLALLAGGALAVFFAAVLLQLTWLLDDPRKTLIATGICTAAALLTGLAGFWQAIPAARQGPLLAVSLASTLLLCGVVAAAVIERHRRVIAEQEAAQASNVAEMHVAREIQKTLMAPPQWESGDWSVAALSIPARDVGGDFYEYIPGRGNTIGGVAVGDVSGKGMPAALLMAVVRTIFRIEARRRIFPAESLTRVNSAIKTEMPSGMVTLIYAYVDAVGGWMHFANAGHNYPVVLGDGKVSELVLPGLPLGISDDVEYQERSVRLPAGSSVLFYTDGLVEAKNEADELFGFERLFALLEQSANLTPNALVQRIAAAVRAFSGAAPQCDDITLVVLHHAQQSAVPAREIIPGLPLVALRTPLTGPRESDDDR